MERKIKKQLLRLPHSPGVYLFLDNRGNIIYIGKAADLKSRVRSYFKKNGLQSPLKSILTKKITKIKWQKTDSEIEALILEANLIKKHRPDFNISLKDSSDYFYIGITKELFPKVFITHQKKVKSQKSKVKSDFIGPFTDGTALKRTLQILRKIFPFCTCRQFHKRPCLNAEIGRCANVCCLKPKLAIKQPDFKEKLKQYQKNIAALKKIITGKKKKLIWDLNKEMKKMAAKENFEKAAALRDQIESLKKIFFHQKVLFPNRQEINWPEINRLIQKLLGTQQNFNRIEAYDISHISGQYSVGAMVVFKKSEPNPAEYRRFKIKTVINQDDPAMLKEVIKRRIEHQEWPLPDLILIDGGIAQLNTVLNVKEQNQKFKKIKVLALAKDKNNLYLERRKKPIKLASLPQELQMLILQIRDQAHRFAIKYHRNLRRIKMKNLTE